MLENQYSSLYESGFYKVMVKNLKNAGKYKKFGEFERVFALANFLYLESEKCINFVGDDRNMSLWISGNSKLISAILSNDSNAFEMLKRVGEFEKVNKPCDRTTRIEAAIKVCDAHAHDLSKSVTR